MWTTSLILAGLLAAPALHRESRAVMPESTASPTPVQSIAAPMEDVAEVGSFFRPNDEVAGYILDALDRHPGLQARYYAWRAALQRIPQVTSLEDPMFSYKQILRSKDITPEVMLSEAFPWFGTLRARGNQAAAEAEATLQAFYALRNEIVEQVKLAYFDFALLGNSVSVVESQLEVLNYISSIIEARLALGMSQEDELYRLSIERTQTQDQLDQFVQLRASLQSRLNAALGAQGNPDRPWPSATQLPPDPPDYETLATMIGSRHPAVMAYDFRDTALQQTERLARLSGFPNITLGLEWKGMPDPDKPKVARPAVQPFSSDGTMGTTSMPASTTSAGMTSGGDGDDEWMLNLGMSLPIWRRRVHAGMEEARLMRRAVAAERRDTVRALEGELGQAIYTLADAKRRYHLYSESLIPQAYQTFESLQNRYATSAEGTEFLDVLESVRTMLSFQLAQLEAEKDWQAAAATLERIAGGSLPASPPAVEVLEPAVPQE